MSFEINESKRSISLLNEVLIESCEKKCPFNIKISKESIRERIDLSNFVAKILDFNDEDGLNYNRNSILKRFKMRILSLNSESKDRKLIFKEQKLNLIFSLI